MNYMQSALYPSVRLSVARVDQSKRLKLGSCMFTTEYSPIRLVFAIYV